MHKLIIPHYHSEWMRNVSAFNEYLSEFNSLPIVNYERKSELNEDMSSQSFTFAITNTAKPLSFQLNNPDWEVFNRKAIREENQYRSHLSRTTDYQNAARMRVHTCQLVRYGCQLIQQGNIGNLEGKLALQLKEKVTQQEQTLRNLASAINIYNQSLEINANQQLNFQFTLLSDFAYELLQLETIEYWISN